MGSGGKVVKRWLKVDKRGEPVPVPATGMKQESGRRHGTSLQQIWGR